MVDQPNGTPTAPPTVPVANGLPAAAPAISDDTLVQVVVDRQARQEPLSKLRASYQTQTAAEARLAQANQVLQDNRADVDLARRIKGRLATDPEGAILEMQQFAEKQLGRRIKLPGASTHDDGDAGLQSGGDGAPNATTSRLERQVSEMAARLANLTSTQQVETVDRQIESSLDAYRFFDASTEVGKAARQLAKVTIAGLHAGQPDVAVADHASAIHDMMSRVVAAQVTGVRDQRQNRVETMPSAPTSGGTPELTAPMPDGWGTKKSLRDGTFQRKMTEFLGSFDARR
jgi:hypothetical protein